MSDIKNNKKAARILVKGSIADASGHTDFVGTVDEAMERITTEVKNHGKWVFVDNVPQVFTPGDAESVRNLRDAITQEGAEFTVTAALVGGAPAASGKAKAIYKAQGLTTSVKQDREATGISLAFKKDGDTMRCQVTVNNGTSVARLAEHKDQIMEALTAYMAAPVIG